MILIIDWRPLQTDKYIHFIRTCPNCGNLGVIFPANWSWDVCYGCQEVLSDYGYFDMEIDDEPEMIGICQTCGGEWGDGYTTCDCPEEWESEILWYER